MYPRGIFAYLKGIFFVQLQKFIMRHKNALYLWRSKNLKDNKNSVNFCYFYLQKFQAKRNIPHCCSFIIGFAIVKIALKLHEIILYKGTTKLTDCTRVFQPFCCSGTLCKCLICSWNPTQLWNCGIATTA